MRQLKLTLLIMLAGAIITTVIAFSVSRSWVVERAVVINAPAEKIYSILETPAGWQRWRARLDPSFVVEPGASPNEWRWKSERFGFGTITFSEHDKPRSLHYARFQAAIGVELKGSIALEPAANGTKVTWREWANLAPNPNLRLVSTELVDENFEHALDALKRMAEEPTDAAH